jgi:hypothetical protein
MSGKTLLYSQSLGPMRLGSGGQKADCIPVQEEQGLLHLDLWLGAVEAHLQRIGGRSPASCTQMEEAVFSGG